MRLRIIEKVTEKGSVFEVHRFSQSLFGSRWEIAAGSFQTKKDAELYIECMRRLASRSIINHEEYKI